MNFAAALLVGLSPISLVMSLFEVYQYWNLNLLLMA